MFDQQQPISVTIIGTGLSSHRTPGTLPAKHSTKPLVRVDVKPIFGQFRSFFQGDEKGGLSLRGVAVTTETAETTETTKTAKTVTVVSWHCIL